MGHRRACDFGHYWECDGTALRPLAGDTEPSVCMCIRHRVPMEEGDHSECSIEILTCPEHRELRKMEKANKGETDSEEAKIPDGWDDLSRPLTSEEHLKFEAKRRFMEDVAYVGLENINTGFDSPSVFHFSPTDFGSLIDRCERLQVHINGIDVFTTDGGFIECIFAMDDGSPDESFDWARRLV